MADIRRQSRSPASPLRAFSWTALADRRKSRVKIAETKDSLKYINRQVDR